ncbi:MAG: pitrilysin family protein [Bacteroidales bacterium]|jgi:predicted Zn-dependent peptidase|nr:pitrilysin family protein [Bacteroidales bacterium]NLM93707.1 insulinase family protein [Bacteroidales bacterium]
MKKIFSFLFLSLLIAFTVSAQLDRSQRPQPGPAPVIQLGDFETFKLRNGLQVIVVENHKVPVVSFQLSLNIDPVMEGNAKGYVDMAGTLMSEGTKTRSKQQIAEEIDFIGGNISTFSTGMYASSLKRHQETLLGLMSDILLNPTFPEAELQRNITQSKSALEVSRNEGNFIAGNVSRVAAYGTDHPYGEITTPESLDNINRDLLVNYYQTYWKPNVAYLVVVGDINKKEAKKLAKKYFGKWKKGNVPEMNYPTPVAPEGNRVAMGNRSGAVQSMVYVTYPVAFTPGNPDAIKASVMNSILGGGVFSGRLMQNLREDKGYTYGARSNLSTDELIGRFTASTEVRNSVTDSTVVEILGEMRRLVNEPVTEESLQLVKNFMSGSFARSLESPRTIANFALNIQRYNLPEDYYARYLENLEAVTVADVQAMAAKYLKPNNANIVVAGNRDEVAENLQKFSSTGTVEFFDAFGRPVEAPKAVTGEVNAEQVIAAYVTAIGGYNRVKAVEDLTMNMTASMQGMTIEAVNKQKAPDMFYSTLSMGGNIIQKQVYDGSRGKVSAMGQSQEITGEALNELKLQAVLFPELRYGELGYQMELTGIEDLEGVEAYRIRFTSPNGSVRNEYFSVDNGLRLSTQISQESPMGSMTVVTNYSDYREVNGIMFPFSIKQQLGPQMLDMKVTSIEVNSGLDNDAFLID